MRNSNVNFNRSEDATKIQAILDDAVWPESAMRSVNQLRPKKTRLDWNDWGVLGFTLLYMAEAVANGRGGGDREQGVRRLSRDHGGVD